jgi:hypothetical protein
VVPCCLLGRRILLRRGIGVLEVILNGEAGLGTHSHSAEAGFIWVWWIQAAIIFAMLTAVGIDKITTKGPLQWGFNGWTFNSFT